MSLYFSKCLVNACSYINFRHRAYSAIYTKWIIQCENKNNMTENFSTLTHRYGILIMPTHFSYQSILKKFSLKNRVCKHIAKCIVFLSKVHIYVVMASEMKIMQIESPF